MTDNYYSRPEVSNSDLSELKRYLYPEFISFDPTEAYRFGNLFDYMVTEPGKVNFLKRTIPDYEKPFTKEQWDIAIQMKKALDNDHTWNNLLLTCKPNFQKVCTEKLSIQYGNLEFSLPTRCKYDFYSDMLHWGGDLKSTVATTQKQFEEAFWYFDYPRSRAWYMDISGSDKDIVIGVSKENFKVFKIYITRNTEYYLQGKDQYTELAFKYWMLYEGFNHKN